MVKRKDKNMSEISDYERGKVSGMFKGLKAACPETEIGEFESWMMHQIHEMWKKQEINSEQLALLIDEVCCY